MSHAPAHGFDPKFAVRQPKEGLRGLRIAIRPPGFRSGYCVVVHVESQRRNIRIESLGLTAIGLDL